MSANILYLVPGADQGEQVDDDFMEAVVEVGARIGLQAPQPPMAPEQKEPPGPHSNVVSFAEYVKKRTAYEDSLPAFVPFDEFGKPVWTR